MYITQTCIKKYGDNYSKDFHKKAEITNKQKYGTSCTLLNADIKKKTEKTMLKKYGVKNALQSDIIQNKKNNTMLEKYGDIAPTRVPEFIEKSKATCLQKYGVTYAIQLETIKEKRRQTIKDRFGGSHAPNKVYFYDNEYFDSSWELAFYIYHKLNGISIYRNIDPILYEFDNKTHRYYPDFLVNGQLYEIKGDQFFKEDGTMICPFDHKLDELYEAKHQCGIRNNVIFLKRVDIEKYIKYCEDNNIALDNFKLTSYE